QYYRDLYNAERIEILKGPNAMIFGRGGAGGVINRVTKRAEFEPIIEGRFEGGSFGAARGLIDLGGGLGESVAARLNAVYENSDSYRDNAGVERYGVNPSATLSLSGATEFRLSYEYFHDGRTVDRGVPSQNGLPYAGSRTAYFGNPDQSFSDVDVHFIAATVEHQISSSVKLRNHTIFADYDKFYQNVHANSSVNAMGDVALQAYFSGTERRNFFNQTDLIIDWSTGSVGHTILFGGEFGHQDTENTRAANNNAAGVVNIADPTTFAPVTFNPLSADNSVKLMAAAVYLQDQVELADWVMLIGGVRVDRFDLEFDDLLPASLDFSRVDTVVSPRGGIIVKPIERASLYASYSKSFLPQSGDQFASLTATTASLEPERFENIEVGFKWDLSDSLAFTGAVYRLDRDNTQALDPMTSMTVLTGSQRSKGVELGIVGSITEEWEIIAGYAYQEAEITSTTTAAPAGRVIPLVPKHSFSLWSAYQFTPRLGAGVGVTHQSDVFASISNAVVLPAFTRVDAAVFLKVTERLDVQLNVENIFDETYWGTAHNDNNITPGSPRAFRAALTGRL
ncbi:MAG: TonB-dependent siderophore receptor, partial [Parvularculaceae bacterium]